MKGSWELPQSQLQCDFQVSRHYKTRGLTLFSKLTLSCNPSTALSLSCSSISWEQEAEALMPPSSMPSKRATLLPRQSLHIKRFHCIVRMISKHTINNIYFLQMKHGENPDNLTKASVIKEVTVSIKPFSHQIIVNTSQIGKSIQCIPNRKKIPMICDVPHKSHFSFVQQKAIHYVIQNSLNMTSQKHRLTQVSNT